MAMTLKNLVKRAEIEALGRDERDAILRERFHVTADDLVAIRRNERVIDRVIEAAALLYQRLQEAGVERSCISAQFTINNLAYLIDNRRLSSQRAVGKALNRQYREKRDDVERRTGLRVPYTQLLREEIGAYSGNLYDAKKMWPEICVSAYDWLKDVRIPCTIGRQEATLIGIYLSAGNIVSSDGKHYRLELWGRNDDFEFYETIDDMVLRMHNNKPISLQKHSSGGFTYNIPGREISSPAIMTWLLNHLQFSKNSTKKRVPLVLKTHEQRTGLLAGIIAAGARIYANDDHGRTRWRMRIEDNDREYLASVKELAESIGYHPVLGPQHNYVDFNKEDIKQMVREGLFINPTHMRKTMPLLEEMMQPKHSRKYRIVGEDLGLLAFLYNCGVAGTEIAGHFGIHQPNMYRYLGQAREAGYGVVNRGRMPQRPFADVMAQYKLIKRSQQSA